MSLKNTTRTGAEGENVACQFLAKKGFDIIERNYRKPWGEIDIIALKNGVVRFVEVKAQVLAADMISRESDLYSPEQQIHHFKLKKIIRTAELYMETKGDTREFQIDAVVVLLDMHSRRATCRHYEQIL